LLAQVLQNANDVGSASAGSLLVLAKQLPQGQRAQSMSQDNFTSLLEQKLVKNGLLKSGNRLSVETATAAKEAAEIHGNVGRSPTIGIDPNAPNPFTPGTIGYNQYNAIVALNAANPAVNALRLTLQLPGYPNYGRNAGLPYELARAQFYATQGTLVDVEHPVGTGEADLLLSNNQLVDAKAWSQQMWKDASVARRDGTIRKLAQQVRTYLDDSAGYTLRIEFKYTIPPAVLLQLQQLAAVPAYQNRLTWAANVN